MYEASVCKDGSLGAIKSTAYLRAVHVGWGETTATVERAVRAWARYRTVTQICLKHSVELAARCARTYPRTAHRTTEVITVSTRLIHHSVLYYTCHYTVIL